MKIRNELFDDEQLEFVENAMEGIVTEVNAKFREEAVRSRKQAAKSRLVGRQDICNELLKEWKDLGWNESDYSEHVQELLEEVTDVLDNFDELYELSTRPEPAKILQFPTKKTLE